FATLMLGHVACGDDGDPELVTNPDGTTSTNTVGQGGAGAGGDDDDGGFVNPGGGAPPAPVPQFAELWYSVDSLLVHIDLDEADGTVEQLRSSPLSGGLPLGQNALTMLDDGTLLGSRLADDNLSYFYRIDEPPRDGSEATPVPLGVMPDSIRVEGLYTDCAGRVYAMDTGTDNGNADGNRLLRFTGDPKTGDFTYVQVSDLGMADVADIDDMGPAIVNNEIVDNPGLAIDTGTLFDFNYETGTGEQIGSAGTFGIHALGGELFDDGDARLYAFDRDAFLYEVTNFEPNDINGIEVSDSLVQGPEPSGGIRGWSGLAGPLTDCESGFTGPR
ncbi:MAG: hypothetical protein AAGA56_26385, partial [Myxococcota bacterium]